MKASHLFIALSVITFASLALAQTLAPVVPSAAPAAAATAASPGSAAEAGISTALKLLQQTKAANDELLREQAATIQQLEEIEKAAEQIKIFSKRG
jgi:Spy/CpxP family protein refolding chaperone